jgi:hypothetical protein
MKTRLRNLDLEGLTRMMQSADEENEDLLGRILIVEDLTAAIIELLGSSLEIDPLFFASHLHAARSEKTAQQPDVRLFPSTTKSLKFLCASHHRPLTFVGKNIPRRVVCDANVRRKASCFSAFKGIGVGISQHLFSAFMSRKEGRAWVGK